eukprot:TRINITY_DN1022_c0_g1_i1.p1 TRINITY_DN1022_c0_g1~~TRINITY_DN1022_c0_g1_i1.p1  ORF type:complete len:1152 (+),score=202.77 TRINITY_DN1022_c0_g1_i1:86-3541(+)
MPRQKARRRRQSWRVAAPHFYARASVAFIGFRKLCTPEARKRAVQQGCSEAEVRKRARRWWRRLTLKTSAPHFYARASRAFAEFRKLCTPEARKRAVQQGCSEAEVRKRARRMVKYWWRRIALKTSLTWKALMPRKRYAVGWDLLNVFDKRAEAFLRDAAVRSTLVLGRKHRHTLEFRMMYGRALYFAGQHKHAQDVLEETVALCKEVCGESHRDTLRTEYDCHRAARWASVKQKPQVEQDYLNTYLQMKKVLGENAIETLVCRRDYATMILERRDHAGMEMLKNSIAQMEAALGPDHSEVAEGKYWLGAMYLLEVAAAGQVGVEMSLDLVRSAEEEARVARSPAADTVRDAVRIWTKVQGPFDRGRAALGRILGLAGDYENACKHHSAAIDGVTRLLGARHRDTIHAESRLALMMFKYNHHSEAIERMKRVVRKAERAQVRSDYLRTDLGRMLLHCGDAEAAVAVLEQSLNAVKAARSSKLETEVAVRRHLGRALLAKRDARSATDVLRPAVEKVKRECGEEDPSTIELRLHLVEAMVQDPRGLRQEAEEEYLAVIRTQARLGVEPRRAPEGLLVTQTRVLTVQADASEQHALRVVSRNLGAACLLRGQALEKAVEEHGAGSTEHVDALISHASTLALARFGGPSAQGGARAVGITTGDDGWGAQLRHAVRCVAELEEQEGGARHVQEIVSVMRKVADVLPASARRSKRWKELLVRAARLLAPNHGDQASREFLRNAIETAKDEDIGPESQQELEMLLATPPACPTLAEVVPSVQSSDPSADPSAFISKRRVRFEAPGFTAVGSEGRDVTAQLLSAGRVSERLMHALGTDKRFSYTLSDLLWDSGCELCAATMKRLMRHLPPALKPGRRLLDTVCAIHSAWLDALRQHADDIFIHSRERDGESDQLRAAWLTASDNWLDCEVHSIHFHQLRPAEADPCRASYRTGGLGGLGAAEGVMMLAAVLRWRGFRIRLALGQLKLPTDPESRPHAWLVVVPPAESNDEMVLCDNARVIPHSCYAERQHRYTLRRFVTPSYMPSASSEHCGFSDSYRRTVSRSSTEVGDCDALLYDDCGAVRYDDPEHVEKLVSSGGDCGAPRAETPADCPVLQYTAKPPLRLSKEVLALVDTLGAQGGTDSFVGEDELAAGPTITV